MLRVQYDAVFVHMNEEYILLGGLLWRLWGKRVVLWRNHKKGSLRTRAACTLSNTVCYTSSESFVARAHNAVRMPVGIDTKQFAPSTAAISHDSILFFGRIDTVKNPDIFIGALMLMDQERTPFHATVCGSPTHPHEAFAASLKARAQTLVNSGKVVFRDAVTHDEAPALYAAHAIYINLTPSGSFDKTIGEAMASGLIVVAANAAVKDALGDLFIPELSDTSAASAMRRALAFSGAERSMACARNRQYIEREHSLSLLVERLQAIVSA
jgi:glycosyltransferase involved in cell wall biosynthesis